MTFEHEKATKFLKFNPLTFADEVLEAVHRHSHNAVNLLEQRIEQKVVADNKDTNMAIEQVRPSMCSTKITERVTV